MSGWKSRIVERKTMRVGDIAVNVKCKLMNTMYFYVPQSRERLIFIGIRKDLDMKPSYPMAKSEPITIRNTFDNLKDKEKEPQGISKLKETRWQFTKSGENHFNRFSLHGLAWNKPNATIQKTISGSSECINSDEPRKLYEGELKRIGSYPDGFCFLESGATY